jgi:hypothetical protein
LVLQVFRRQGDNLIKNKEAWGVGFNPQICRIAGFLKKPRLKFSETQNSHDPNVPQIREFGGNCYE